MSGAVQRLIRSKTKLVARCAIIMLQMIKFTISLDRLEIKAVLVNKSSLLSHEVNPVYLYIPNL